MLRCKTTAHVDAKTGVGSCSGWTRWYQDDLGMAFSAIARFMGACAEAFRPRRSSRERVCIVSQLWDTNFLLSSFYFLVFNVCLLFLSTFCYVLFFVPKIKKTVFAICGCCCPTTIISSMVLFLSLGKSFCVQHSRAAAIKAFVPWRPHQRASPPPYSSPRRKDDTFWTPLEVNGLHLT